MTAALALPGNTAATFLTHFLGPGLADDDRYVVERFKAMADGDIRRWPDLPSDCAIASSNSQPCAAPARKA